MYRQAIFLYNNFMKNTSEKILFTLLNIFISSWHLQMIFLIFTVFGIAMLFPPFENDEDDINLCFLIAIFLIPIAWMIKNNLFNFIYKLRKTGFTHDFLEKIIADKIFRRNIFLLALLIDILNIVIYKYIPVLGKVDPDEFLLSLVLFTILFGGNLTTSYLSFYLLSRKNVVRCNADKD